MKNSFVYRLLNDVENRHISNVIDFEFDNLDGFVKVYTNNGTSCLRQSELLLFGWQEDLEG